MDRIPINMNVIQPDGTVKLLGTSYWPVKPSVGEKLDIELLDIEGATAITVHTRIYSVDRVYYKAYIAVRDPAQQMSVPTVEVDLWPIVK